MGWQSSIRFSILALQHTERLAKTAQPESIHRIYRIQKYSVLCVIRHSGIQVEEMLSLLAQVDHSEDQAIFDTVSTTLGEEYPEE